MGLTRLLGGASGITNQPIGLDIGIGGSNFKVIQRGQVNTPNNALTGNITISEIDTTKSIVLLETVGNLNIPNVDTIRLEILNSTTLKWTRDTTNASSVTPIAWQVIQFNNVKSLQRGTASITGASPTITISSVDTLKSLLFTNFTVGIGTSSGAYYSICSQLTNSTTITGISISTLTSLHYQVIEFN